MSLSVRPLALHQRRRPPLQLPQDGHHRLAELAGERYGDSDSYAASNWCDNRGLAHRHGTLARDRHIIRGVRDRVCALRTAPWRACGTYERPRGGLDFNPAAQAEVWNKGPFGVQLLIYFS